MSDVAPGNGDILVNQTIPLRQEPMFNMLSLLYIIQITSHLVSYQAFILSPLFATMFS